MRGIIHFEVDGIPALGFDTDLNARSFAQTKSAQLLTQPGWIVMRDGSVKLWKLEGVIEREGTMVIWGKDFAGETLDTIVLDSDRKNIALNALRIWIRARIILSKKAATKEIETLPMPYPVGVFIDKDGSLLFPPTDLIEKTFKAERNEKWRLGAVCWLHPDLTGNSADIFSAGTMLYRIFCRDLAFKSEDFDVLRQDLREGVFVPPYLMIAGLDAVLASLITNSIEPFCKSKQKKSYGKMSMSSTSLEDLENFLGELGSKNVDSYIDSLNEEKQSAFDFDLQQFRKKQDLKVKRKRFVVRNTAIITACSIIFIGIALVAGSIIENRLNLPTTKGMSPVEVIEAYYGAIGSLDHVLMEACVIGGAGKEDINLVTNYFVLSRVRQAYEMGSPTVISAQSWIDAGSPITRSSIFGVSHFNLEMLNSPDYEREQFFRVSYLLWLPISSSEPSPDAVIEEDMFIPPVSHHLTDTVKLVLHRNAWRIADIQREMKR